MVRNYSKHKISQIIAHIYPYSRPLHRRSCSPRTNSPKTLSNKATCVAAPCCTDFFVLCARPASNKRLQGAKSQSVLRRPVFFSFFGLILLGRVWLSRLAHSIHARSVIHVGMPCANINHVSLGGELSAQTRLQARSAKWEFTKGRV